MFQLLRIIPNLGLHLTVLALAISGLLALGLVALGYGIPTDAVAGGLLAAFIALFFGIAVATLASMHEHIQARRIPAE